MMINFGSVRFFLMFNVRNELMLIVALIAHIFYCFILSLFVFGFVLNLDKNPLDIYRVDQKCLALSTGERSEEIES